MSNGILTRPRTLLTYGRFDLFDQDHVHFLRHLSRLGDALIVGCATDDLAERQGMPCQMRYDARAAMLSHCRYVTRVVPQSTPDQHHTDIVNYDVAVLAMGQEWRGQLDHLANIVDVMYLPRRAASDSAIDWSPNGRPAIGA